MAAPLSGIDQNVRSIRVVHSAFMATVLLYVYAMHIVQRSPATLVPVIFWSLAGIAVFCCCGAYFWRVRKLSPAVERLRVAPDDAGALAQWRGGSIVSVTMLETVVLFGFALYMLGATTIQVAPFVIVPFVTMILWFPKRP